MDIKFWQDWLTYDKKIDIQIKEGIQIDFRCFQFMYYGITDLLYLRISFFDIHLFRVQIQIVERSFIFGIMGLNIEIKKSNHREVTRNEKNI